MHISPWCICVCVDEALVLAAQPPLHDSWCSGTLLVKLECCSPDNMLPRCAPFSPCRYGPLNWFGEWNSWAGFDVLSTMPGSAGEQTSVGQGHLLTHCSPGAPDHKFVKQKGSALACLSLQQGSGVCFAGQSLLANAYLCLIA